MGSKKECTNVEGVQGSRRLAPTPRTVVAGAVRDSAGGQGWSAAGRESGGGAVGQVVGQAGGEGDRGHRETLRRVAGGRGGEALETMAEADALTHGTRPSVASPIISHKQELEQKEAIIPAQFCQPPKNDKKKDLASGGWRGRLLAGSGWLPAG